ncbi:peptidoglycan-binding protein [Aquibium microcysteis]|uniref:peptidoglycan-binding protein n=1 Tax=Aquibium microcysteis TaxID=675281 RepID=UPI00165D1D19|nr:peptidoglycan-binding protein [Aquibium microcysteis]
MTFTEWLQGRLVAHGYRIRVDGQNGGETKAALIAFQQTAGLRVTAVADEKTVAALRMNPRQGSAAPAPAPEQTMPPWMAEMHRRMGLHEVRDNAVLIAWLKIGKFLGNPAELPWCGDGVESAFVKGLPLEPLPANPFFAQNWIKFGWGMADAHVGAVGVIKWSPAAGHVGIVADSNRTDVCLLGANQSNAVTLAWFPRSNFIGFRWPKTFPLKAYPPLKGGKAGDMAGTR